MTDMRKMKRNVLLFLSPHESGIFSERPFLHPPLALGMLARVLRENGHEVRLVDLNVALQKLTKAQVHERLGFLYDKEHYFQILNGIPGKFDTEILSYFLGEEDIGHFDIVGISLGADFSIFQIHFGFYFGSLIQKHCGVGVVFGGNNVQYMYSFRETFSELWSIVLQKFPAIILGPGERSLSTLVEHGIKAEPQGKIYMAKELPSTSIQYCPIVGRPDFESLDMSIYGPYMAIGGTTQDKEENATYLYSWPLALSQLVDSVRRRLEDPNFKKKLVIPYIFNYGCPYSCAFCEQSQRPKKPLIIGNVDNVIDDLCHLRDRWETEYFYFLNNAVNNSLTFMDYFCERAIQRELSVYWSDCARFNGMTKERIAALREAGCRKLVFGLETASPALLKYIDKRVDLRHAERVLEWCKNAGIWVDLEIIIGLPYENEVRFAETVDFIERNKHRLNSLFVNEYFVVPDSLIGKYPESYGIKLLNQNVTYEEMLVSNAKAFSCERLMTAQNFRAYAYEETQTQRSSNEIAEATHKHAQVARSLIWDEFSGVQKSHELILEILDTFT